MKYTNLTRGQLADNFERVAQDFYKLIGDNGLEETEVDMSNPSDNREPDLNLCDTPACHGGWAAIVYGLGGYKHYAESSDRFYLSGAKRLAEELGFGTKSKLWFDPKGDLECWALRNPFYWGSDTGGSMFTRKSAFNKRPHEPLHLKDIANWYMNVSKRLRGEV